MVHSKNVTYNLSAYLVQLHKKDVLTSKDSE